MTPLLRSQSEFTAVYGHNRRGLSGTKPGSIIKNQIPIKTNQLEETKRGFMEADTVAVILFAI